MKIILNSNSVKHTTEKAILVKLPGSDYTFWHPLRFANQCGKGGYKLTLWVANAEWKIKAERKSDKTYKTLSTWEGTVGEAAEKFGLKLES